MLTKPPLPFQGNKSIGRNEFINIIKKIDNPDDKVFVDLFGGSLYLSYLVKHTYPHATVIANDFDNYKQRLLNVNDTNRLLNMIREELRERPRNKKIDEATSKKIKEMIKTFSEYIDVLTLSVSLLFSGKYASSIDELLSCTLYNKCKHTDYNQIECKEYLDGLTIVRKDWLDLFEEYRDKPGVVFIADPPYLYTDKGGYNVKYWKLYDSLKTLDVLRQERFIYYTSTKSGLYEVIEYFKDSFGVDIHFDVIKINRIKQNRDVKENAELLWYKV